MITYEDLLIEAEFQGIYVIEKEFKSKAKGLCKGNKIGIRNSLPTYEKNCILAEEIGHYETTVGNILDQTNILNIKKEWKARKWAHEKLLPREAIEKAFRLGYTEIHDLADHFNVSENFVRECFEDYGIADCKTRKE